MHLGPGNQHFNYSMGGLQLEATSEEKDVGVIVTANLKPATQCARAAARANAALGQLTRALHFRDRRVFLDLYKTHVRPHLEYAVQAWSPHLVKDTEIL